MNDKSICSAIERNRERLQKILRDYVKDICPLYPNLRCRHFSDDPSDTYKLMLEVNFLGSPDGEGISIIVFIHTYENTITIASEICSDSATIIDIDGPFAILSASKDVEHFEKVISEWVPKFFDFLMDKKANLLEALSKI